MALVAEEMDGLSQPLRTLYVEHVRSLVVYNIIGDRLQYPDGTGGGLDGRPPPSTLHLLLGSRDPTSHIPYPDPTGMRSARFGGVAAQNMRLHLRRVSAQMGASPTPSLIPSLDASPPRRSPRFSPRILHSPTPLTAARHEADGVRAVQEKIANQMDVEQYFAALHSFCGYKPAADDRTDRPAWTGPIRCATRRWWRWRGGRRAGRALGTGGRTRD